MGGAPVPGARQALLQPVAAHHTCNAVRQLKLMLLRRPSPSCQATWFRAAMPGLQAVGHHPPRRRQLRLSAWAAGWGFTSCAPCASAPTRVRPQTRLAAQPAAGQHCPAAAVRHWAACTRSPPRSQAHARPMARALAEQLACLSLGMLEGLPSCSADACKARRWRHLHRHHQLIQRAAPGANARGAGCRSAQRRGAQSAPGLNTCLRPCQPSSEQVP